jgi:hypothetical protein
MFSDDWMRTAPFVKVFSRKNGMGSEPSERLIDEGPLYRSGALGDVRHKLAIRRISASQQEAALHAASTYCIVHFSPRHIPA